MEKTPDSYHSIGIYMYDVPREEILPEKTQSCDFVPNSKVYGLLEREDTCLAKYRPLMMVELCNEL